MHLGCCGVFFILLLVVESAQDLATERPDTGQNKINIRIIFS
jgi:hypothetical protein